MNERHDELWRNLITASAPAYAAGGEAPPYGLATRLLARHRAESGQRELTERIGLRALWAALSVLALTAVIAVGVGAAESSDWEPGVPGIVQAANMPLS